MEEYCLRSFFRPTTFLYKNRFFASYLPRAFSCDDHWSLRSNNYYALPLHFSWSFLLFNFNLSFSVFPCGFGFSFRVSASSFPLLNFSLSLTFLNSHFATSLELNSDLQLDSKIPLWFLWIILLLYVSFRILPATTFTEPTNSHIIQSFNIHSTHLHSYGINLCIYKYEQLITYLRLFVSHRPDLQY